MRNKWEELIGHEWAVELLRGAITQDRVGHAYLITGPAQVGKTTLARLFAQALNCEANEPAARPCGQCRACRLIGVDRHPDIRLLEAELSSRGKRTLKIEEIRELQQDLNLAAYEARRKVAILTHFDAATQGAANAFLKTLEEPPGDVVLLLTATEADALLPTITSRCRIIPLRPLPAARIARDLQTRRAVPAGHARLLAHLADGRLGWAIEAVENPDLVTAREEQLALLQEALAGRRVERFALAEKLAKNAEALPVILRTWQSWWRDLALLAWGDAGENALVNINQRLQLDELARHWSQQQILLALEQTGEALWQLAHNANTRLVLENLFLRYPYHRQPAPIG